MNFQDLSYEQRRGILRNYYVTNKDAHKAIKTLAFNVMKELKNPIIKDLVDFSTIINYLIDGYIAFEIISIGSDLMLKELDPITLTLTYRKDNNELCWSQNIDGVNKKIIEKNNILYISYYLHETSFLSSMYIGLIDPNDDDFIFKHVDYIVDRFSNKKLNFEEILKVDSMISRSIKIQRLKK